ncbi:MAG: ArsR family transcriptional regulator [Elusimicrobiota bacterium]|nr:ArsR family transcriptional regulator [Elusimicrobiota bacterium]
MKTLEIQIKSREQADKEFASVFNKARSGKKVPPQKGVYFTSLEAVRNLLTEKRLELLHLIRQHSPKSISEIAKISGRNFKNVHTDLKILQGYGLVEITVTKKVNKPLSQRIFIPYQAVNIHAWF